MSNTVVAARRLTVFIALGLALAVSSPVLYAQSLEKTLYLLGFEGIGSVSTVKVYHIQLSERNERRALEMLEEMCEKLLANPVIHNYSVRIL